jgi:hypothetical protein
MSSGLDWVFENVDRAIILEDDCVPHPSFFRFSQELLERYAEDERVMMVAGTNMLRGLPEVAHSYIFSRNASVWGWATWRRAWRHNDVEMKAWPAFRDAGRLRDVFCDERLAEKWRRPLDAVYEGKVDTWDTQWEFACWVQSGLTIVPRYNLVENIGFGRDATHTKATSHRLAAMSTRAMDFPLLHPDTVLADMAFDRRLMREVYFVPPLLLLQRIIPKLRRWLESKRRGPDAPGAE